MHKFLIDSQSLCLYKTHSGRQESEFVCLFFIRPYIVSSFKCGQCLFPPCQCHFAFPGYCSSLETWWQGCQSQNSVPCLQGIVRLCQYQLIAEGSERSGKGTAPSSQGMPLIRLLYYVGVQGIMCQDIALLQPWTFSIMKKMRWFS